MIVSVTGLKPKGFGVQFWMHAIPCAMQARSSLGLLHFETFKLDGINHTFTAWESREHLVGSRFGLRGLPPILPCS